jgi:HEPN domain-containing protein
MESNKQQTAVEWLIQQILTKNAIKKISTSTFYIKDEIVEQAKEIEKEQIVSSYEIAYMDGYNDNGICGEDYYKENFN